MGFAGATESFPLDLTRISMAKDLDTSAGARQSADTGFCISAVRGNFLWLHQLTHSQHIRPWAHSQPSAVVFSNLAFHASHTFSTSSRLMRQYRDDGDATERYEACSYGFILNSLLPSGARLNIYSFPSCSRGPHSPGRRPRPGRAMLKDGCNLQRNSRECPGYEA